ncbi:MAG: PQQ-dependent sugar dehydrogenase [Anaeromyxobacter sp.]
MNHHATATALLALALTACQAADSAAVVEPPGGDRSAPSVPTGLSAVAPAPDRVELAWNASSDSDSGVAGYRVLRDGAGVATVAAPATSWVDQAVAAATAYTYTVRAFDLADPPNTSADSAAATVTTPAVPDVTPPTTPQGLAAVALSPTRVALAWSASTDAGTGLAGYQVSRDGALLATVGPGAVSYEDGTATPATAYAYTLRAFDHAVPANVSAASAPAQVTTPSAGATPGLDSRPSNPTCLAPVRPTPAGPIQLTRVFPGLPAFSSPLALLQAPGDTSRWFVVEQGGRVRVFANSDGVTAAATFVDLTAERVRSGGEMGLLGMAFHPDWPAVKEVFLSFTGPKDPGQQLRSYVSRFTTVGGGTDALDSSLGAGDPRGGPALREPQRRLDRLRPGRSLPVPGAGRRRLGL